MPIDQRMRDQGERFIEAAIALDLLDEDTALKAIDDQARDRLIKATAFDEGEAVFEADDAAVERMAGTPVDLVEGTLSSFLSRGSRRLSDRMREQLSGAALEPTRDFEPGLVAFARLRPTSALSALFVPGRRCLLWRLSMPQPISPHPSATLSSTAFLRREEPCSGWRRALAEAAQWRHCFENTRCSEE